jgi:formylglycine-generating enzyme required for sulfatase activity
MGNEERQLIMYKYSRVSLCILISVVLIACSNTLATDKISSSTIEQTITQSVVAVDLPQQDVVTVTNIISGSVISSTVYQARIISKTNTTIVQADAESPEQAKIRIVGEELIQAIKAENNVSQKVDIFLEETAAAIAANVQDQQNLIKQVAEITRVAVTRLTIQGDTAAGQGDFESADYKFELAYRLNPPLDTPIYVKIPAGEAIISHADYDEDSYVQPDINDMSKQEIMYLKSYWILRTEVTNAQYQRCVDAQVCKPLWDGEKTVKEFPNYPATPAWDSAKTYAQWIGGRLPTDAEWEKACRGTDGRLYPWGNNVPEPALANYGTGILTAVGQFPNGASPYGLLDMAGNAYEYTSENFRDSDYGTVRGGSDWAGPEFLRCTMKMGPAFSRAPYGFRVVIPTYDSFTVDQK